MKTAPKVFCPSCGVPWHPVAEPKPTRKQKIPVKPKAMDTPLPVIADDLPDTKKPVKKKATVKKATTKKKRGSR